MSLKKETLATLAGNFAVPASALVTGPLLARTLGESGRGVFASVQASFLLIISICTFGLPTAIAQAQARQVLSQRVWQQSRWIMLLGGIIGGAILVKYGFYLDSDYVRPVICIALSVPAVMYLESRRAWLYGEGAFTALAGERWLGAVARMTLLIAVAWTGWMSPTNAVVATTAASLLGALMWRNALKDKLSADPEGGLSISELLRFSRAAWFGSVAGLANVRLDQVVLAAVVPPREIGYYAIAVTWSGLPQMFVSAVQKVVTVRAPRSMDDESLARICRVTVTGGALLVVGTTLTSPWLVPLLFGAEFRQAVLLIVMLAPGEMVGHAGHLLSGVLLVKGHPWQQSRGEAVALGVTVVGLAILLPLLGIVGAAITSSAAYCAAAVAWRQGLKDRDRYCWVRQSDWAWARQQMEQWRLR